MKKFFKGIVWPRGKIQEDDTEVITKINYRYVIIGMLITDKPIESFENKNEIVIEGASYDAINLEYLPQRPSNIKVGDASDVLLNLKYI